MDLHLLKPFIVPAAVIYILARRLIRNKPQKVKVGRLFVIPAIVIFGTVITLGAAPLPGFLWLIAYMLAIGAGLVAGFFTAHHQEFLLDYETGKITSKATPIGSALVVGLFAINLLVKFMMPDVAGSPYSISSYTPSWPFKDFSPHSSASLVGWTDVGLIFSAALLTARAATTYLRARKLIAEHKVYLANKPTAIVAD